MCEKCERQATNPTAEELATAQAEVDHLCQAIAVTIQVNLGPARGPIEAAIRIAAARAWAQVMEEGVAEKLTPAVRAFGERLVQAHVKKIRARAEEVDPTGERRASAAKQTPPACAEATQPAARA